MHSLRFPTDSGTHSKKKTKKPPQNSMDCFFLASDISILEMLAIPYLVVLEPASISREKEVGVGTEVASSHQQRVRTLSHVIFSCWPPVKAQKSFFPTPGWLWSRAHHWKCRGSTAKWMHCLGVMEIATSAAWTTGVSVWSPTEKFKIHNGLAEQNWTAFWFPCQN